MAHAGSVVRAFPLSVRAPDQYLHLSGGEDLIDLRALKVVVRTLVPAHPLRILVLGEPNEISREEYVAKVSGWFRLLRTFPE